MSDPTVNLNDPKYRGIRDNVYPNAFFDYLTKLLPKQLKLLFVWLEYLYVNCGQIFAALKKFSEYPITEFTINTDNKKQKEKLEFIFDKVIKLKSTLINIGIDFFIYGNSFFSVYKPFDRWLICKHCKAKYNSSQIDYDWKPSTFEFVITCTNKKCGKKGIAEVKQTKSNDIKKLKVIRWDAKYMDINFNPITEESEYFYNIPTDLRKRIKSKKPDKFLINTLPWEFLETIKDKKIFKFGEGQLYHMKAPAPAGINKEWGFPSLLSAMKPFFYTAILRKANEAIALDHIVPMRILYPQGTTTNNDPTQYVSLSKWRSELEDAVKKWRRDPNYIKFSPIPVGVENMGGDGRAMLTIAEVQAAEENIITSMGIPKEFLYGGLSHSGGSVTLRMLENQLFTYTSQIKDALQWIADEVCLFANIEKTDVDMTDFVLIDDIEQKQMAINVGSQMGILSKTTIANILEYDLDEEREKMHQEAIDDAKLQQQITESVGKIQQSISVQVKSQQSGNPLNYDPMAVIQVAQDQAMQLFQIPMEQRKSMLKQLEAQDPVLYAVVLKQLDYLHKSQREQGNQAVSQQTGMDPSSMKPGPTGQSGF